MKKGIAIPYIIALILGIAVVALIGYWFFFIAGPLGGHYTETQCRALLNAYCTTWSTNAYDPDKMPDEKKFTDVCPAEDTYASKCCSYAWAHNIDQTYCENLLGQT